MHRFAVMIVALVVGCGAGIAQDDPEVARLRRELVEAEGDAAEDPRGLVSALNALSGGLGGRRRFAEALEVSRRALATLRSIPDARPEELAAISTGLANFCFRAGNAEEGVRTALEAVESAGLAFGAENPRTSSAWFALASNFMRLRRYGDAYVAARRFLGVDALSFPARLNWRNLASEALVASGRFGEARESLDAMTVEADAAAGRAWRAQCEGLKGRVEFELGRHSDAAEHFGRQWDLLRESTDPPEAELAAVSVSLGNAAAAMGRFDDAEAHYERARAVYERAAPNVRSVTLLLDQAQCALRAGRAEDAETLIARATAHAATLNGDQSLIVARAEILGAGARHMLLRPEEGLELVRAALARLTVAPGASEAMQLWGRQVEARLLTTLGRRAEALPSFLAASRLARELIVRKAGGLSESERLAQLTGPRLALDAYVSAALAENAADPDLAVEVLAWKGLVLRTVRSERAALRREGSPEVRDSLARLLESERRLSGDAGSSASAPGTPPPSAAATRAAFEERERLERALAAAASAPIESAPTPDALTASLGPAEALIDYFVYDHLDPASPRPVVAADPRLAAVVYRGGRRPAVFALGGVEVARRAVDAHVRLSARSAASDPASLALARSAADAARAAVFAPLSEAVEGATTLYLAPDSFLATLPFETLPAGARDRVLLEDHVIVYLQSAADHLGRIEPSAAVSVLLVGDVDFGDPPAPGPGPARREDGAFEASADAAKSGSAESRRTLFEGVLRPCPGSRGEIDGITESFLSSGTGRDAFVRLSGAAATKEAFLAAATGRRVIHLATHGIFRGAEPGRSASSRAVGKSATGAGDVGGRFGATTRGGWRAPTMLDGASPAMRSGVAFAGANRQALTGKSGVWTASEAALADLSACDLIVVSGCDSGLGEPRIGESVLGLRRAFAIAGARASVTALWPVGDDAAAEVMRAFYAGYASGKLDAAAALRDAKLRLLAKDRTAASPYGRTGAWGAFVLERVAR